MKTYRVVIFIAAMLSLSSVSAQETDITRLKTHTIKLNQKGGAGGPQYWTMVETDASRTKRRFSIRFGGLSVNEDVQWLQLDAAPKGGTGVLKDLGELNWAEVDRMPALVLQPIPPGIKISQMGGETFVGPEGFIVKPLVGHAYAVYVKDEHTEYRAIFRVDSIDLNNGDCQLSWKQIPSKWVLRPGPDTLTQQSQNIDKPTTVTSVYAGPAANEILTKVASVYAGCRTYSDEGFITAGFHFRTIFSRPDTLGFELWQGNKKIWVVWKKGDEVTNWRPDNAPRRPAPFDLAMAQLALNSRGGSLLVPQLLIPSLFRTTDMLSLIVDPKMVGEDKVDGLPVVRVRGTLWGQPIELWIDKTDYLIRKVIRIATLGNQQVESTTNYKPKLNSEIPAEDLTFKAPAGKGSSAAADSMLSKASSPSVAPRLRAREFGSSLSRKPDEKAIQRSVDDDVVRVDTDLVLSAVLVLDPQGKIVTGLTKEDFIVKEDNKLQQVESFSLGDSKDLPRTIVLIIDYSPSQLPYIQTSIESAKMLVDKLNAKDRMAIVTDDVVLLTDFTNDQQLLKDKLDGLKRSALSGVLGASLQYDSLMATLNELFDNEDSQPIVIFQTDGDQLDLLKGGKGELGPYMFPRKYGLEDIMAAAERARATIYPVISGVRFLGVPETELPKRAHLDWDKRRAANLEMFRARNLPEPKNVLEPGSDVLQRIADRWLHCQVALAEVAKSAGAWAEFLEEPDQADEIYTRVLRNIERRYVLGYYPTNRARDGKRRRVSIEVRNHPEYTIVGHKSYLARAE